MISIPRMVVPFLRGIRKAGLWLRFFCVAGSRGRAAYGLNLLRLRAPMPTNLRMDPFERAEYETIGYHTWWAPDSQVPGLALQFLINFP